MTTGDLEGEEYKIEMKMYFYKYKEHLQEIMDWEICIKKIFILFLVHCLPFLEAVHVATDDSVPIFL